jgi:hypothetical protein
MHLPATYAKVLYRKIELDREFMKRNVNAVGREKFLAFPLYRFSLSPTSNSNHKDKEIQIRLFMALLAVWLICFFVLVMWVRHIVFG